MGSAWGVEAPNCTITMAVAAAATGTTVCMTMHNWQWSASDWLGCRCVTWATTSIASRTRQRTATAGTKPDKKPLCAARLPDGCPKSYQSFQPSGDGTFRSYSTEKAHGFGRFLYEVVALELRFRRRPRKNADWARTSKLSCHGCFSATSARLARTGAFAGYSLIAPAAVFAQNDPQS